MTHLELNAANFLVSYVASATYNYTQSSLTVVVFANKRIIRLLGTELTKTPIAMTVYWGSSSSRNDIKTIYPDMDMAIIPEDWGKLEYKEFYLTGTVVPELLEQYNILMNQVDETAKSILATLQLRNDVAKEAKDIITAYKADHTAYDLLLQKHLNECNELLESNYSLVMEDHLKELMSKLTYRDLVDLNIDYQVTFDPACSYLDPKKYTNTTFFVGEEELSKTTVANGLWDATKPLIVIVMEDNKLQLIRYKPTVYGY